MKKTILKTKCIIISIAILLQMIGNPNIVKAADPVKASKTANTLMYIGLGLAVTVIIIAITSKKKNKKQHTNLQQRLNYSKLYNSSPIDYNLLMLKKNEVKQNDFAVHFLKSNSWTSPTSNINFKTNLPGFSYDKKWDTNVYKPKQKFITSNSGIPGYNF